MDPPPPPRQTSSPKRSARVYPERSREQASGSPSAVPSSPASPPGTQPTTKAQRSPSYIAPSSPDELLPSRSPGSPVGASPPHPTTDTAAHSPPDDLLFAMPRGRDYELVSSESTSSPRTMSQNDKDQLIHSLRSHRVNTITELRRIERIFAYLDSAEVTEPMTAAWAYYVNSNNLLNELRGLTRNYPFSSELLDDAKRLVVSDPGSVRSWNYCWLVLNKIESQGLINRHARALATKPAMWGNRSPTAAGVQQLANACTVEWTRAVRQLLRHWDSPPSTTGR